MGKMFFIIFCFGVIQVGAQDLSMKVITGAERMNAYLPLLKNKKVALLVNQTSTIHSTHLVDTLISSGITILKIFAPEHGFRGKADAGEKINSTKDEKTGLPIVSMYGSSKKPTTNALQDIDIVVFDIQDVGARFYTYISSLQYMMEACAEHEVEFVILDRPNPNGFYVDGPVLERKFTSFVGMQPIPIVHGMTVGEYALMLQGELWLHNKQNCKLTVIKCEHYTHKRIYELPIPPSPNLKSTQAILLYPSLCLFEGTDYSVGRGTETPFEMYGHPDNKLGSFQFVPISREGAKKPLHENQTCYGSNLHMPLQDILELINHKLQLGFLIDAYNTSEHKETFFNSFFDKLAGNESLRKQIIAGVSENEIRKSWEPALSEFKLVRKKYLLYNDFE
ncbi:MAG: DUF1343 domain-containing protein [Bacteroidetes bacterium]|nr:DUF1343 domain-containing protein [Bacteroidota bacterium]